MVGRNARRLWLAESVMTDGVELIADADFGAATRISVVREENDGAPIPLPQLSLKATSTPQRLQASAASELPLLSRIPGLPPLAIACYPISF